MKSKGKLVHMNICDKIIIQILDIQRQNHHLRNSKRTNSDHDVRVLLENEIASSKSSIEHDQSAMKSLAYSSFNGATEDSKADVSDHQIPEVIIAEDKNSIFEPFHVKAEPFCEEDENSYRANADTPNANECEQPVQQRTDDLGEQSEEEMRRKYLKLQIRNLQIVNYREMLQVIKLERELGIARSELPRSFNFNL